MPEVAKEAALLVDPFSIDSISDAMLLIYKDKNLRNTLVEKGRKRKLDFSWDMTAKELWRSIEKTINA
jgi:glycosyltransferase involved in cell wall biosynthesis